MCANVLGMQRCRGGTFGRRRRTAAPARMGIAWAAYLPTGSQLYYLETPFMSRLEAAQHMPHAGRARETQDTSLIFGIVTHATQRDGQAGFASERLRELVPRSGFEKRGAM